MPDINNYTADDAGYIISSLDFAKGLAQTVGAVVDDLADPSGILPDGYEDAFGPVDNSPAARREMLALRLERAAIEASKLAAALRGPKVDERGSDKIGYDADHSVG